MAKTIDVEGTPQGWPPPGSGRGGGKFSGARPPIIVTVAAAVFGLILILVLLMAASGKLGVANIDAQEVAVVVNYITGEEEVVNTPGFKIYVPFVQEVYTFDKRAQDFMMQGQKYVDNNHVPQLTVRAKDGSNFRIDDLRIQYEVLPGDIVQVLHDSGPGDGYKEEWIKAHARSVLRDEFGRYSAVEVADPTKYQGAPIAARETLNELLGRHGLRVTLIKTPNPHFDPLYEEAIENRKRADQEVERLKAEAEQLKQEKEQRLAKVEREKTVEMQELQGELIKELREAEAKSIRVMRAADEFATKRRAEGEARMRELVAEARGLEAKYRKEAEGIESKAQALEQRGEVVVREAIIQKLMQITFTLVPYSRDPLPQRLEHVNAQSPESQIDPDTLAGEDR